MTKPKPKPLGSTIDVAQGAQVVRPGDNEASARTITGGVYVFDVPGVHTIDGAEHEVAVEREPEAQPKP
jgi:hypothetical protein